MRISRGLEVRAGRAPRQTVTPVTGVALVGHLGSDWPDLRLEPMVAPGDRVARGTPVLRDRKRHEIRLISSVAGVVDEVTIGQRRRLSRLTVRPEGSAAAAFRRPKELNRESARELLIEAGLWSALVARPFGHVPPTDADPGALFVTATDSQPNAPNPALVIGNAPDSFREGVHLLRHLTQAPIFVCQSPGELLVHPGGHVRVETVTGPHPSGLAGTQIARLFPVTGGRTVWHIGYQDVMAIGTLLLTGEIDMTRTVALAGPLAREPRLVALPAGADLETLAADEALPGPRRTLSGPAIGGRESRFLRRGHTQVTILPRPGPPPRRRNWLPEPRRPLRPAPVIAHAALDHALGPAFPAVPLVRALSTGDAAEADRLGVRGLLEEDVALLTYVTGGAEDFGVLLRDVLDKLESSP